MDAQSDYSLPVTTPSHVEGPIGTYVGHTVSSRDQRLVLAARTGCRTAFTELWDLYSHRVYRTLLGITNNAQDAEDALQDTFLRVFVAIGSFEGRANFYTWLTRIAINSALGILRKRRSRPETLFGSNSQHEDGCPSEEFRDFAPDPEQIYAGQEKREKAYARDSETPSRSPKSYSSANSRKLFGEGSCMSPEHLGSRR